MRSTSGRLGSLPYLFGATGVLLGGFLGDWLTARTGSRRLALGSMGTIGLLLAGMLVASSVYADEPLVAVLLCSIGYFFSYIQLAAWWAAMGDVGGRHLGALFGLCNMIGLAGGAISQVFLGSFADYMKDLGYEGRDQWDPAFYLYGGVLDGRRRAVAVHEPTAERRARGRASCLKSPTTDGTDNTDKMKSIGVAPIRVIRAIRGSMLSAFVGGPPWQT